MPEFKVNLSADNSTLAGFEETRQKGIGNTFNRLLKDDDFRMQLNRVGLDQELGDKRGKKNEEFDDSRVAKSYIDKLVKKGVNKTTAQFILLLKVGQEKGCSILTIGGELIQPLLEDLSVNDLTCNGEENGTKNVEENEEIECLSNEIRIVYKSALRKLSRTGEIESIPIKLIVRVKKDLSSPIEISFEFENEMLKRILEHSSSPRLRQFSNVQEEIDTIVKSFEKIKGELKKEEEDIVENPRHQNNNWYVLKNKVFNDWYVSRTEKMSKLAGLYKELGRILNTRPRLGKNYGKLLSEVQKKQIADLRNEIKSYCIKKRSPFLRGLLHKLGQFFRFIFGAKTDVGKIHDKLVASKKIKVINSSVLKLQNQLLADNQPSQNISKQLIDLKAEVAELVRTTNYYLLPEKDEKEFKKNINNTQRIIEESINFLKFNRDKTVLTKEIIEHLIKYQQQSGNEENFVQLAMKIKFVVSKIMTRNNKGTDYLQEQLNGCFTPQSLQQIRGFIRESLIEQHYESTSNNMLNEIKRLSESLKETGHKFDISSEYITKFLEVMKHEVEGSPQKSCAKVGSHRGILLGLNVNPDEVRRHEDASEESDSEKDTSEESDVENTEELARSAEKMKQGQRVPADASMTEEHNDSYGRICLRTEARCSSSNAGPNKPVTNEHHSKSQKGKGVIIPNDEPVANSFTLKV